MKKFFLTTPIYYPNARPHVGSAYTTIVCDVLARYRRMCGEDVAFLTGTDEHGEKLERAAAAAGVTPREFVAEKRKLFLALWKKLGIDNLRFVYTDQPDHVISVQRLLRLACQREPGVIYKGQYHGRYCISDERYIADGTEPADCDICGRPAELISEENYFFKLSAFQSRLLEHYDKHPEFIQPDFRRNEVLSFVKAGLRDISVSRKRIKWGIPWPDDPEHVFYVWYDALTSYLTGIGYAQGENGGPDFQKYWLHTEGPGEIVHMIGKDILRFHAVYWPAFLLAAGLPLPTTVFAHGWIYYEQDKMSKSKGNIVYPEPIIDTLEFFGAPGNDALRYYLLREAPFGQDMNFSYEGLIQRYNADLANDLGNLVSRTLTMVDQYFNGRIPPPRKVLEQDLEVSNLAARAIEQSLSCFRHFAFPQGLEGIWTLITRINQYLVENQPWALAKDPAKGDRLATVLWHAAESLRIVAVLLSPSTPEAAGRIWQQLGLAGRPSDVLLPQQLKWGDLRPGTKIGKPEPVFPRLDKEATLAKLDELVEADLERDKPKEALKAVEPQTEKAPGPSPTPKPQPAAAGPQTISIEDFAKVDMRAGQVVAAERVPGTNKLLKLNIDIGTEVRQVVAGIAEVYSPEQLVGMKVVVVTNLQPRKVRGVESNGMIVAATVGPEGRPVLVTFKEDVPNGAPLK
jgi:methionyl-tRNA synthetase